MKLSAIITGATGMVGEGILQACITHPQVEKILLINRRPSGYINPKVEELLHSDFNNISSLSDKLSGYNACYFCAGVSSVGMNEAQYTKVTYDLTLSFAKTLSHINPQITFCYVSGAGTDNSEKGRQMWARVKGKTENDLTKLPFKAVYNFRPAFMKPTRGAKHVKGFYKIIDALFPFFRFFSKTWFLTLEEVGRAMINVSVNGYHQPVLEVDAIAKLSK